MSTGRAPRVAVVDYGVGNRRSVEKALARVGARAEITRDPEALRRADGLVVPGVGAFGACVEAFRAHGLEPLLRERLGEQVPVLGICVGMQMLFERSSERGEARGLGLLAGSVDRLAAPGGRRLPHIAWSTVRWQRETALNAALPAETAFYHVHSYAARPEDPSVVAGVASYGSPFVSAVVAGDLYGVQFHAEKSSTHGLGLLAGFVGACARRAVAA